MLKNLCCLILSLTFFSCSYSESEEEQETVNDTSAIGFSILDNRPHDINSFIEGLEFYKGSLYESAAFVKELPETKVSSIGVVNTRTGEIDRKIILDKHIYFSEGITILRDKIYHVTYKNQKGFVYDAGNYKKLSEFSYNNAEGWGLTNDGTSVIMSDGTHTLTYFDPESMQIVKTLPVYDKGSKLSNLNELEFINGFIYANIYLTNQIVKIDTSSGEIVGKIDCSVLKTDAVTRFAGAMEMNGIAFNPSDSTVWVTGKMWPSYYRIKFRF